MHSPSFIEAAALGRRLAQVRAKAGLTQSAFAEALGIPRRSYVGYEHGSREAPIGVIKAAHEVFGADLLWLLTGVPAAAQGPSLEEVDFELVHDVVYEVRAQLADRGKALRPTDQARLVRLLYAWFRETGRFDRNRVGEVLDMAIGQ